MAPSLGPFGPSVSRRQVEESQTKKKQNKQEERCCGPTQRSWDPGPAESPDVPNQATWPSRTQAMSSDVYERLAYDRSPEPRALIAGFQTEGRYLRIGITQSANQPGPQTRVIGSQSDTVKEGT